MKTYIRLLFLSRTDDIIFKKFKVKACTESGQSFEFSSWRWEALSQAVDTLPEINDDVAVLRAYNQE